ncbi:MAG: ABC transporter ATP-binding protein [Cyclobacteriaceae bacterium]|nr:ABC transporter ATP-binding protein [Cyclobacteriaceae bacterium]MCK5372513.1 ABC transporter ATP-binding protein [Cyclobacteriaceae bacterium]MCK5470003.1 ABC transporter ATP-binding protein [Cyclobacteriaceae bacterium]MCK5704827.1 ABC transporter ATP-binding protein [Cyclobacteriaceae bacterium]
MSSILKVEQLSKTFNTGQKELTVLQDISFEVEQTAGLSIVGPSGSGKTTLLGLCAGLDQPTTGKVSLIDIDLNRLNEDDRAYVRNQYVGFVFQNFQLLPTLTALENVMIPLELRGGKNISTKAESLLDRVGLAERMHHYPSQLSGGEQQRVAMARAFITDPKILFADEPTGNLDEETAEKITNLLFEINLEKGTTLVLVTHNLQLAAHTGRILKLKGGKLIEDKAISI